MRKLQSTLEASRIEWPALRNHIPCMAHVIQLASWAFMGSLGLKGTTKSWETHERDQQFGENESINIRKSQRLRKEGNATINKVSAMRPGLAEIIENVSISRYFGSPETDLHIVENACYIDYADTWSLKRVHWLSKAWVRIAALPVMDVMTGWNPTLELAERAYWLRDFTCPWLQNPKYSDNQPLFPTRDEWTIVKYVMEDSRRFRYWNQWGGRRGIQSHFITLSRCSMTFSITWMALCNLWLRRRLNGRKTWSSRWS